MTRLSRSPDGFAVRLDGQHDVAARAVVIASGVQYRRLEIPSVAHFEGRGIYYAATESRRGHASARTGRRRRRQLGSAAALFLAQHVDQVHVLIRRDHLSDTMRPTRAEARSS